MATFLFISNFQNVVQVAATGDQSVKSSGDLGAVPPNAHVQLAPLPQNEVTVSPAEAVGAATEAYNLQSSEIDGNVGVVRAVVTVIGNRLHQQQRAWIVTADRTIPTPPGQVVFHKLCIVVDANTGRAKFSYGTDPTLP